MMGLVGLELPRKKDNNTESGLEERMLPAHQPEYIGLCFSNNICILVAANKIIFRAFLVELSLLSD
ncbi:MAG: hypothetical protein WBZ36_02110 [Candidatus Nitrosopolaris sp.]